jgi:hypothetical protein
MVAHQYVGVHPDAEDFARTPKSLQKARPVMIVAENHAPFVASASDVIKSIGVQDSQWTRHNSPNNCQP